MPVQSALHGVKSAVCEPTLHYSAILEHRSVWVPTNFSSICLWDLLIFPQSVLDTNCNSQCRTLHIKFSVTPCAHLPRPLNPGRSNWSLTSIGDRCGSANRHTHHNYLLRNCMRASPRALMTNHTSTLSLHCEWLTIPPTLSIFLRISTPILNTTRHAQSSRALDNPVSETSSCLRVHTRVFSKLEGRMVCLSFISLILSAP